jgi:uncharacterized membrane protein
MFDSTPLSIQQKVGVIILGFFAGAATAVAASVVGCLIGIAIALCGRNGLFSLGEYQGWLPLIGMSYGFYAGVIIGLIVCWRFCTKRLT